MKKAVSRTQLFEWFRCFKYGRTSLKFDELPGHPVSSRNDEMIAKVHDRLTANLRTSSTELAVEEIKFGSGKGNLTKNSGPDTFINEIPSTAADSGAIRAPVGCSL
jgi:hypothetical protein